MSTDRELADRHRYRLLSGEIAVNVTTISGILDMGKSGGMAGAAAKLTRQGQDYRAVWKSKADTGTRVHAVCEAWLRGEDPFVLEEDNGYVDALEDFWKTNEPEMVECEAIALSSHGYGGRFDLIARLNDGRTGLIDLKAGKPHAVAHLLQLAAYRYADGIANYDDEGTLRGVWPIPPVDFAACLYVREDKTWSLTEYAADEGAFARFLALLDVYKWATEIEKEERRGVRSAG